MEKIKTSVHNPGTGVMPAKLSEDCQIRTLTIRKTQKKDSRQNLLSVRDLIEALRTALTGAHAVASAYKENYIVIHVKPEEYERLGEILQKIHNVIEKNTPERKEHLFIVIRDNENAKENIFKIWKNQEE